MCWFIFLAGNVVETFTKEIASSNVTWPLELPIPLRMGQYVPYLFRVSFYNPGGFGGWSDHMGGPPGYPASLGVRVNSSDSLLLDVGYPEDDGTYVVTHYRLLVWVEPAVLLREISVPLTSMEPRGVWGTGTLAPPVSPVHRYILPGIDQWNVAVYVTVAAQNLLGTGPNVTKRGTPPSLPSFVQWTLSHFAVMSLLPNFTVSRPSVPRNLTLLSRGVSSLQLILSPPLDDNGAPVLGYAVHWNAFQTPQAALVQVVVDRCGSCVHGRCSPSFRYQCTCHPGFQGSNCDQCAPHHFAYPGCAVCRAQSSCSGNGVCNAAGQCLCNLGFTGSACDRCAPGLYGPWCVNCSAVHHCSAHGQCSLSTGECVCASGFFGRDCAHHCDPAVMCSGHGRCNQHGDGCECHSGFGGLHCDAVNMLSAEVLSGTPPFWPLLYFSSFMP